MKEIIHKCIGEKVEGIMKKGAVSWRLSVGLVFSLLIGTFFAVIPAVQAQEKESRTIRVAYPIQKGLTDIDENGNYCGYTYEYLEEIAQYTGWDYEFVRAEGDINQQLTALMDMVRRGEADLMGATFYSEELGERYGYASHSYGSAETVLQVPAEKTDAVEITSQAFQQIRIAVIGKTGRMIRELDDYCKMNLVDPVLVECAGTQEQVRALHDGRADVMLNSSLNYVEGVRTIARFAAKPFYFIMPREGTKDLAAELSQAILYIEQADPYLTTALFEKYFSPPSSQMLLTEEEDNYIRNAQTIRVGVLEGQPPFQYMDGGGELTGISIDLLNVISEKTGLQFSYTRADTTEELNRLAEKKEIDMVAGITYNYETARKQNLSMTRPYVSAQYILVTTADQGAGNVVGKRLALPKYSLFANRAVGKVTYFQNAEDCLEAVREGKADYTYVDSYTAQYFINLPKHSKLNLIPQTFEQRRVCCGVVKPGSRELLSILNKAVVTLPEEELQALINQNTIVPQPHPLNKVLRNALLVLLFILIALLAGFCAYYVSTRRSEKSLKAAKALAEDAYDKAKKASLAKSEFLSRMSHEIRTPMNGISGMTAIAIRNLDNKEKVAECLNKVQMSSRHLLNLINDILDMAKIESGRIEFQKEKFDFGEFLENLNNLYYGQAAEKKLAFETVTEGSLNGQLIGDSLRLNQVLGNLLSNACKFTPSGGTVRLLVSEISRDEGAIWMRFEVQDTGCGIAPEHIDVIFESFEQGDAKVAHTYGGTGLGLAIVKRFTESMGGRISVKSIPGSGSTFTVELPFGNPGQAVSAASCQARPLSSSAQPAGYDFTGRRILLAEDNELNREIATELIGAAGAALEPAVDGAAAVERFAASPVGYYDLILMDLQMPVMNGYDATRKIRSMAREDAARIPIVAMTADAFAEDGERCLAAGMNAHISKPIDIDRIYAKLNEIWKKEQGTE